MGLQVTVSDEAVDAHIRGLDRLLGFRTRLELPMQRITGVAVVPRRQAERDLRIRTGGTVVPGIATVGYYRGRRHKRQWWRVYRARSVLTIDLDARSTFDRVVLQCDDAEGVAFEIRSRLAPPAAQARDAGALPVSPAAAPTSPAGPCGSLL